MSYHTFAGNAVAVLQVVYVLELRHLFGRQNARLKRIVGDVKSAKPILAELDEHVKSQFELTKLLNLVNAVFEVSLL